MKTVAFYSYKGGVGRTLALVTLAKLLSKIGKKVCVIDFDFEAPGLHHKLVANKDVNKGFIDYLVNCAELLQADNNIESKKAVDTIYSIDKYCIKVKQKNKEEGRICLLPAGDIKSDKYWFYVNFKLPEIFRFAPDKTDDPLSCLRANNMLLLFDRIKQAISDRIKPDYLLIDSRSGITERAGVCTRLWADDVVAFFACNRESMIGTRMILRGLQKSGRLPFQANQQPINIFIVLSRIPPISMGRSAKIDKLVSEAKEFFLEACKEDMEATLTTNSIFTIEEDIILLTDEDKAHEWEMNTPLARDYFEIFTKIVLPTDRAMLNRFRNKISREGRMFEMNPDTGVLINPADMARNVAFRVDTFSNILLQLANILKEKETKLGVEESAAELDADNSLRVTGASCGKSFIDDFVTRWNDKKRRVGLKEKIDEWCAFDSDVGFGIFSGQLLSEDPPSGFLCLKDCFLKNTKDKEHIDISTFIEGYIEGVLLGLIGGKIVVTRKLTESLDDCYNLTFYFTRLD